MDSNITTINQLVSQHFRGFGETCAFHLCGRNARSVSFGEFAEDIEQAAAKLEHRKRQIRKRNEEKPQSGKAREWPGRERVLLAGESSYAWIVAALAIICAGDCCVPVDMEMSDEEIRRIAEFSKSSARICSASCMELFAGERGILSLEELTRTCGKQQWGEKASLAAPREEMTGPRAGLTGSENREAAMMVFTSGTMGRPKGVMLSQGNLLAVIRGSTRCIKPVGEVFSLLPLNHTYSFVCGILGTLSTGETIILNDRLRNFVKNLKATGPSMIFAVPLVLERMRKAITDAVEVRGKAAAFSAAGKVSDFLLKMGIDQRKRIFREIRRELGGNLNTIICGGAPLNPETAAFFQRIGVQILNGYGITECAPLVSVVSNKENNGGAGDTVGKPIYTCQVKLGDTDKRGHGEILVKGENVMLGYYRDPQATAAAFEDGWFKTGDMGFLDEKGNLYIRGRIKNMILLDNGKNVYPEDIEALLSSCGEIDEALVYLNEESRITAEIYSARQEKEASISQLIEMINQKLPMYSQVEHLVFRSQPFEKTTSQKIKRKRTNSYENITD